jgi:hypothetical protein
MQNQPCLQKSSHESKIEQYKFSIYHKACLQLDCEKDSSDSSSDVGSQETEQEEQEEELFIQPNTKFYEKQNFTAYLSRAKREIIDDLDLFSLATSAIHGKYISDKEYVEYNEDDDQFVCIKEDTLEQDANEYFKENNMPYRWSHRGSPAFAMWNN